MLADRRLIVGLAAGAVAVVVALALALGTGGDDDGSPAATAGGVTSTTRDLSSVTDEELAQVVAENPDIVPMRLRLVERYLRSGELESAQRHAEQSSVRATTIEDRARALRYLGWTTALLGEAEQGEGILVQSLALDPTNRDALYFLGRTRYQLLDRPDLALEPLEQLATMDMDDEQRRLVDTLLAEVQVAVGISSATTTTTTSVPSD